MNQFKLLGIRPLQGCHERFLKNLTAGYIYNFYSSTEFFNERKKPAKGDDKVCFLRHDVTIPQNLYAIQRADTVSLSVNISAIVGKNGAGKSTIIELLFAAIYVFSIKGDVLSPNFKTLEEERLKLGEDLRDARARYYTLDDKRIEVLKKIQAGMSGEDSTDTFDELKTIFANLLSQEKYLLDRAKYLEKTLSQIPKKAEDIRSFIKDLKVELYYQYGPDNYKLVINSDLIQSEGTELSKISELSELSHFKGFEPNVLNLQHKEDLASHFFYTIAVNYSHYSLNANIMGDWINALFHKNDGYATPVVINPMRNEGNFDINNEINFAKYRLLSNVLVNDFKKNIDHQLTDHQYIHKVRFTLNKKKIAKLKEAIRDTSERIIGENRGINMIMDLFGKYFEGYDAGISVTKDFPLKKELINYIVNKVDRIAELYPGFENGYQTGPEAPTLQTNEFIKSLIEDGTHVTYKLNQAVNFLRYCLSVRPDQLFYLEENYLDSHDDVLFEYSLKQLSDWMGDIESEDIINHLPPSIFNIEFILINKEADSTSSFDKLSSGEQQLVHAVQSVIYHLNNIQSAHNGKKRMKYEMINIIYDEIELYFHPEYQRAFVSRLISALGNLHLKNKIGIKAINVLFLTHSPFILSDIPAENTMLLKVNEASGRAESSAAEKQTFAANINDLLADNFFLKGTLMGTFAESQLNRVIAKIKSDLPLSDDENKLVDMVGDSYLKSSLKQLRKLRHDQN